MRTSVLLALVGLSLSCILVSAGEGQQEDGRSTGGQVVQVRGGPVKARRQEEQQGGGGDVEMSDEPAEAAEAEKTKPKKKKTPEEIEAGKKQSLSSCVVCVSAPSSRGAEGPLCFKLCECEAETWWSDRFLANFTTCFLCQGHNCKKKTCFVQTQ